MYSKFISIFATQKRMTMSAVMLLPQHSDSQDTGNADFRAYLEHSLRDPFTLDLHDCSLMEVIRACIRVKTRSHPNYTRAIRSLIFNLRILEQQYRVTLLPLHITDVFWGHFISFCQDRGLKLSSIDTMCCQLRSILNWGVKYNVQVSPTYGDFSIHKPRNQEIALTADEVSRVTYFDIDRFSDMVRIAPSCFDRNIFRITQQKTGNLAVVNIDRYSIDPRTTYRILERYNYEAPYKASIGNYNSALHTLMRDIGLDEVIRIEERVNGKLVIKNIPKWQLISSHTARRTAITINVLRGHNIHILKRCSGHTDLRMFDNYVRDD